MWKEDDLTIVTEYWKYYINSAIEWVSYSLSNLLFNTPFLSWLEWKPLDDWTDWVRYDEYEYDRDTQASDYHKINLVLLSTDEERIIYIENNTL